MLVKILSAEIGLDGTIVTFNCDVRDAYVSLPGSIYLKKGTRRFFPSQYSVPEIIENIKFAKPLNPKVAFTLEDDFPIIYKKGYIRRTYRRINEPPSPIQTRRTCYTKTLKWSVTL